MADRARDPEGSPEKMADSREGLNSPMDPDSGQKDGQAPPAADEKIKKEEQAFTGDSANVGDSVNTGDSVNVGISANAGDSVNVGNSANAGDSANAGNSASAVETSTDGKGKGNLILRLLNSEGMRYLFIGGCTTMVNLVVYALLCRVVRLNVNVSNIISVSVSILFAYVTNKLIVFRSHCSSFSELAAECGRFIGARLATMVIEVGGVFVLYEILHQNEMVAKLATQVLVVIGNYFISRFLVFKDRYK